MASSGVEQRFTLVESADRSAYMSHGAGFSTSVAADFRDLSGISAGSRVWCGATTELILNGDLPWTVRLGCLVGRQDREALSLAAEWTHRAEVAFVERRDPRRVEVRCERYERGVGQAQVDWLV